VCDGHERDDVVHYWQKEFLPIIEKLELNIQTWDNSGNKLPDKHPHPQPCHTVLWFHDESTFYVHDCQKVCWVHSSETPRPKPKGEGAFLMVADFVSADHRWLRSLDGNKSAQHLFQAGKSRDGYFTNEDILEHIQMAMDILDQDYPHEEHVFLFDNATIHLKRADNTLSA
jgi:hypothetical protein